MLRHDDWSLCLNIRKTAIVGFKSNKQCCHGFDRKHWPENKNPRLQDLTAKKSRIRDTNKHKKTRFRDWKKNFRDPEFSRYYSSSLHVPRISEMKSTSDIHSWRIDWPHHLQIRKALAMIYMYMYMYAHYLTAHHTRMAYLHVYTVVVTS